jgi:hypothetical protein
MKKLVCFLTAWLIHTVVMAAGNDSTSAKMDTNGMITITWSDTSKTALTFRLLDETAETRIVSVYNTIWLPTTSAALAVEYAFGTNNQFFAMVSQNLLPPSNAWRKVISGEFYGGTGTVDSVTLFFDTAMLGKVRSIRFNK